MHPLESGAGDRYPRAFFDRYLLAKEGLPLGPSTETTDVIWHAVK